MAIRSTFIHSRAGNCAYPDDDNHEVTKDTNTHEGFMLTIVSPLSEDLENLAHDVIACCLAVHRELGPGLLESVYPRAVAIELEDRGISFEMEKPLRVNYRGQLLCHQRLDIFIAGDQLSPPDEVPPRLADQLQRAD